jgi:glycosyltransferase involved in cell wall biosynthesis
MKEELMKYPNCGRIVRIHPGVVLPPRTSPANRGGSEERKDLPLVIGCAARLIPGKGVDVLLRAASLVTPADRVCVRVAGDGPDRGRLKDLAQLLGIGDRTKFEGWVDDMSDFWRGCDVAVVPSHQWVESFGMVVIEAMASGIPVIASRKGGLTEAIVPGVTGAHFQPGDFAELARLLNSYLENKELRERHGAAARSRCQAMFGIERCAADFEDLISGLLSKGPA